jgi:hypothetical protein
VPEWSEIADFQITSALAEAAVADCDEYRWAKHPVRTGEWLVQCGFVDGAWAREYLLTHNWYRNTYRVFPQSVGGGFR